MNQRFFRLGSSRSESRHIAILSGTSKELPVYLPTQIQREHILGSKEIRCLLVHDHVLLRQGLRRLLEDQPDIEVVAEAGNAAEALDRVFDHRPEVVITDPHIFECTADQAERLILKECPHSKVLFLMTHERENTLQDSQSEGTSCAVRRKNWWRWSEGRTPVRKPRCRKYRKDAAENGCPGSYILESAF
jgi:CheY-like chemotaxis protein